MILVKFDVAESTGRETSRLIEQLDRLAEDYRPGDMVVFPISISSGALAEVERVPGVVIDRVGPEVVRIRRRQEG